MSVDRNFLHFEKKTPNGKIAVWDLDSTLLKTSDGRILMRDELRMSTDRTDEASTRLYYALDLPEYWNLKQRRYDINMYDPNDKEDYGNGTYVKMWGMMRPYWKEALEYCGNNFDYNIAWTAAITTYGYDITNTIGLASEAFTHVWTREQCDKIPYMDGNGNPVKDDRGNIVKMYTKPLQKLLDTIPELRSYTLADVYTIDDNPEAFQHNPDNAIQIPPYSPDLDITSMAREDIMLKRVIEFWERPEVKNCTDVRILDKSRIFN